jgi:hypothetical protein
MPGGSLIRNIVKPKESLSAVSNRLLRKWGKQTTRAVQEFVQEKRNDLDMMRL